MPLRLRPLPAGAALLSAGLAALASPALAAPPIREHTCADGLTVLVAEDHALPLVTVEIAARNGSMTEPPEYNGLSHLYEHMFFKANKVLPNQEQYLARTRELGMSWNGTTNTERVNYFFTTTTDHLDEAMVFMRDAIVSPLFEEKELGREREVVVGEIDRNHSTPSYHFWHALTEHAFWKFPSRKNPLGDEKTVRAATQAKMRTIQERYYIPNNSVLVITGDVSADAIFARADALYAGWARGPDPFVKFPLVKHPAIRKSEVVVVEQPVQTFTGTIEWHGPSTMSKDVEFTYAADVLGTALGEPSSRFQKALVDSGACVRASLSWSTQRNVGPVLVYFEAAPDKAAACAAAAFAELPRIEEAGYLTDEDLANAVHSLEIEQAHERERSSSFAHTLTFAWTSTGLDYYRSYLNHVKRVTRADIARFMHGFVLGKPFVLAAMVSPEMAAHGLDRATFEKIAGLPVSKADQAQTRIPVEAAEAGEEGSQVMRARLVVCLAAAFLALAACEDVPPPLPPPQPTSEPPPAVTAAPVVADPAPVTEGDVTVAYANGVKILVKRIPGADFAALQLYVRGGARDWTAADAGIERLALAAATSGGTEALDKDAFARRLAALGSELGSESRADFSAIKAKSLGTRWDETFALLADTFLHPALPEAEVALARQRQLSALRHEQESPDALLGLRVHEVFFKGHPFANRSIGTVESVEKVDLPAVKAHLAKLREASRLLFVTAGDVDPAHVVEKVRAAFGALPRGSYAETPFPAVSFDKPSLTLGEKKLPTNYIEGTFPAPRQGDADAPAALVTMSLLRFRLFEEVRTKRNLSYAPSAGLSLSTSVPMGYLYVTATDPNTTLKVMLDEARRIQNEPVSEKDLAGTRATFLTNYLMTNESCDGQAAMLADAELLGGSFRLARTLPERIRAVTPAAVQAYARKYLSHLQTVVIGDPSKIDRGLFESL